MAAPIFSRLPSKSPTVAFICASASRSLPNVPPLQSHLKYTDHPSERRNWLLPPCAWPATTCPGAKYGDFRATRLRICDSSEEYRRSEGWSGGRERLSYRLDGAAGRACTPLRRVHVSESVPHRQL